MHTAHIRRTFHNDAEAAGAARGAVRELRGALGQERLDTLALLVSEVVTNAVRHSMAGSGAGVELDLAARSGAVRAEVIDHGVGFDPGQAGLRSDPGGWGLYLLDELADDWGVTRDKGDHSTTVWFELGPDQLRLSDDRSTRTSVGNPTDRPAARG